MGLSSAINASMNGLNVTGKWAQVTSGNIANMTNEGYGRKTIQLNSGPGGSIFVTGIQRETDDAVSRLYQQNLARGERQSAILRGIDPYISSLGGPENPVGVINQITRFHGELSMLANEPGHEGLQRATITSAVDLARGLNRGAAAIEESLQLTRSAAAADTGEANSLLTRIGMLGNQIFQERDGTLHRASLEDELSRSLEKLSEIMDFRVERTARGEVNMTTNFGTPLIERNDVKPLTYDAISGRLLAGEIDITPGESGRRGISEGRLSGHLEVQNRILPKMQAQMDEIARALIEGFRDADPTVAPPQFSIFVDADPGTPGPLSSRIAVNPGLQPENGGATWRIRDGLGATAPGLSNDNRQILAFASLLDNDMSFAPEAGLVTESRLVNFAAVMVSAHQYVRVEAEEAQSDLRASTESVALLRSSIEGVNLDQELQNLLTIEQNYAANATVMRTLKDLFDIVLSIA